MHQTQDNASTDYDGTGFISKRGSSGSFTHQFYRPGTYYFSSGFIDQGGFLDLKGMVVVQPALSHVVNVDVKVNGKDWCLVVVTYVVVDRLEVVGRGRGFTVISACTSHFCDQGVVGFTAVRTCTEKSDSSLIYQTITRLLKTILIKDRPY